MDLTEMSYEDCMKRLNEIIAGLEKGNSPLSDSMKLFEEGTMLIRRCTEMLNTAEQKVVLLEKGAGDVPVETPYVEKKK